MSNVLSQINDSMAAAVSRTRESLVEIRRQGHGSGSGVVCHRDGLIVTSAHVIGDGPAAVAFGDGTVMEGRVLAYDQRRDLAAISVEAGDLSPADFGDASELRPGQWLMAMGHPGGRQAAVAAGVVLGVDTEWPEAPASGRTWLVASLPLRPGFSGGPLVDGQGRLVGINTMITGPEVGLAVPVNSVATFLKEALELETAA